MIRVEVAYALPGEQFLEALEVNESASVMDAIRQSGLLDRFPDLDQQDISIGIFSKPVSGDAGLRNGDRIEIYRPLTIDPKEARRLRATAKKKKK
ncbi:MAG: RnfH family protein [Acidiferrobacterales bacterium]|nr:RnfH family protein [Acidiferrobacterales bacterium]